MLTVDDVPTFPAQPLSALRVLSLLDDPNASTADLARLVETDPGLSAQVLRLANSAYYGLSGTVASARRAVVLLGFTTVRALAVTAVCTLMADEDDPFTDGFWPHALASAVSTATVARRCGVPSSDAFTAGLLHDVGVALLRRRDGDAYAQIQARAGHDRTALLAAERDHFGLAHPEAAATTLRAWRLPQAFVRAVESHHHPVAEQRGPLSRVLVAGEAVAQLLGDVFPYEPAVAAAPALAAATGRVLDVGEVVAEARLELDALGRFLELDA